MRKTGNIIKWILRGIVVAVIMVVLLFIGGGIIAKISPSAKPPSITDAPWIIQTTSRIYYGKEFQMENGQTPALNGWWDYDGKHYTYHNSIIDFPAKLYGAIDHGVQIIRRGYKS